MANGRTLTPEQLAGAVQGILKPPQRDGEVLQRDTHSLVPVPVKQDARSLIHEVEAVPVELVGRNILDADGKETLGWVYDGSLWVDDTDLALAGGMDTLGEWLAAEIRQPCIRVIVHGRGNAAAHARAEFLVQSPR
jgi:hypothetical protein